MQSYILSLVHQYRLKNFLIIGVMLIFSACVIQPPVSDLEKEQDWDARKSLLNNLNFWRLAGRISIRFQDDAWSASLYWQQEQDSYNIKIVAPLSQGTIELIGDMGSVSLRTHDDQVYTNDDVDLLLQKILGLSIPVSSLKYWIKGIPDPDIITEDFTLEDRGKLSELIQSGWHVKYQAYTRSGGIEFPSKLEITHDGLLLKISINNWTI
jgi:outer membrane lipoprotein LolB